MTKNVTTVNILGSSYKIACPSEEAEAVKEAAIYLDERLREIKEDSELDDKNTAINLKQVKEYDEHKHSTKDI